MSLLLALAGLAFLVLGHELAHYLAARAVGLNPFRFMLFFPPVLFRHRSAKTEWGIGTLPLGGFVSIAGMHRPGGEAILALRSSLGDDHEAIARLEQVLESGEPLPLAEEHEIAALVAGNARALRQLETLQRDLAPDAYWRAAPWRRIVTVGAGPLGSLLIAFLLAFIFYVSYSPSDLKILQVMKGSPAAQAQLKAGDVIRSVDGHAVHPGDLGPAVQQNGGKQLTLVIERSGRTLRRALRPEHLDGAWKLGVAVNDSSSYQGHPIAAAAQSGRLLWQTTKETGSSLSTVASKPVGRNGAVSGPVGIVDTSSGLLGHSLAYWPIIFALVSLALALTNALPIPPLDGGHLLIALIEWLRGKPLSRRAEQLVIAWGVAFIVIVFAVGFLNDLLRFN